MQLREMPVCLIDCQATGMRPESGSLIELAWLKTTALRLSGPTLQSFRSSLVALPEAVTLPRRIRQVTGISQEDLIGQPTAPELWKTLLDELREESPRPLGVAHYARYEQAFLTPLHQSTEPETDFPFAWICTHRIAKKLIPELPAFGIRALSGFFGVPLPEAHRSGLHLEATARIWKNLVDRLEIQGIETLEELGAWLKLEPPKEKRKGKHYLVERNHRLALPDAPGVYRMCAREGTILYVGKATSLKSRVNGYFKIRAKRTRLAEMLAQVTDVKITPTDTPLESALLETDEIKKWEPQYNTLLRGTGRKVWFASPDYASFSNLPEKRSHGPFSSPFALQELLALGDLKAHPEIQEILFPGEFQVGLLDAAFPRLASPIPSLSQMTMPDWLRLGFRFLKQKLAENELAEACDEVEEEATGTEEDPSQVEPVLILWNEALVADRLKRLLRRSAREMIRARWLIRLSHSTVAWSTPLGLRRCLCIEKAEVSDRRYLLESDALPVPSGWNCREEMRQIGFDFASFDRMRVLYSELKRLVSQGERVQIRLSPIRTFSGTRLARALV